MTLRHQKLAARLILGIGVALGLAWLARLDYARKISTDVLDLIPADERAPELVMVRSLAGDRQARVALFALDVPAGAEAERPARRERAARAFAETLARSPALAEVVRMDDPGPRDALGTYVFQRRFDLLLPAWLASRKREYAATGRGADWNEWLAGRTAADLEAFLARPEALVFQPMLPADPLLLVPGLAEQVQGLEPAGPGAGPGAKALIWARTTAPPLAAAGQAPVFAAVAAALKAARAQVPGATLRWTSVGRFAALNRREIESEMSGLNLLSLAAVLAVAALAVKRLRKVLNLAPVILCSLLGAWVVTTMCFERVHVLVFVVGSLLGGVAVDYGFYLYLQPPRYPGEPYEGKVRRLLKPLLASALTAMLGFSLLLRSELPLIRQLGVFVSAGLFFALAAALLWFAQVDDPFLETRAFIHPRAPARGGRRGWRWVLLLAAAAVALAGPWRLRWRDDVRSLDIPAPALQAEATEVRALFGETADRTVYLTRGETPAAARAALARFQIWHERTFPGTPSASLGLAVPTEEEWRALPEELARLDKFEPALRAALAARGFEPEAFAPFFAAWRELRARTTRPGYDALVGGLDGALHGPLAMLMSAEPGSCWYATVAAHPPGPDVPPELSTVGAAQLQSLNRLFARYRISALRLSATGLALVGLSVFVLYGIRRGARIFALPLGSCLFAFGVFGLCGQTLNLFHLLGAFLGVCLCHNYAIFSAENAARGETPPPSIRLSALSTAASFGVLALSHIPVVSALGSTVALIVLTALAAVELA